MTHYSEDDLVLFFYGEGRWRKTVERHLDTCHVCATLYRDIADTLTLVTPPDAPARDDRYGLEVWQRIRPVLPMEPPSHSLFWWPTSRLALAGTFAGLIVAAFITGRVWPTSQNTAPAGLTIATTPLDFSDRIRAAAIGDHLEESERLLLDFVNAGGQIVDFSGHQALASDLIDSNRLYRDAASGAGEMMVAEVLDELERSLMEISHGPSTLSLADFNNTRMRLDAAALLFKVRVLADELHEREISTPKTPKNDV